MLTVIDILTRLVSFKTLSLQPNIELIDYVESYLARWGVTARRIYSEDGQRASLYATLGTTERGGICFSGHSDVVPVSGQPWQSDPFVLRESEGRYYGRGSADMKGYLACVLALVPEWSIITRQPRACPIHIAISYDEEIGCVGVRGLLEQLAGEANRPAACIIGEPTMMQVATAHKGKRAWRCCIRGQAAHSSQPQLGVNAIEYAAELIHYLRQISRQWQQETGDRRYTPPYSTLQVGTIQGGTALNVVADHCTFDFEVRPLPGSCDAALPEMLVGRAQDLEPEMQEISPAAGIQLTEQVSYPGLKDDESLDSLKVLCAAALDSTQVIALSFGTEAGLFQAAGIPTVVCGPGSITVAHKADEYIEREQLEQCVDFLRKIVLYAQ